MGTSKSATVTLLGLSLSMFVACGPARPTSRDGKSDRLIGALKPTPSTWDGIHVHLVFLNVAEVPNTVASRYDFIWGADDVDRPLRDGNSSMVLSKYIPFAADPQGNRGLRWWQDNHPDWIVYRCDQTTPAYFGDWPNIPLDITNPEVRQWQFDNYIWPASEAGFDAMAFDNGDSFGSTTTGACGVWKGGQFVRFHGGDLNQRLYDEDSLSWRTDMHGRMHALPNQMRLIPNFGSMSWWECCGNDGDSEEILNGLVSYSDDLVDEQGFTYTGGRGVWLKNDDWINKVWYAQRYQRAGKAYHFINQLESVDRDGVQWALSSYLMAKENSATLWIGLPQQSGYGQPWWLPEYDAASNIGHPCGDMREAGGGAWIRDYSGGFVMVNPTGTGVNVQILGGAQLYDLYGSTAQGSSWLNPQTGIVLVTAAGTPSRCDAAPPPSAPPPAPAPVAGCTFSGEIVGIGGKAVEVPGQRWDNGAPAQLWDGWGGDNQKWTLEGDGTIRVYGGSKCLDAAGVSSANGTSLQIWDCWGGENQRWSVNGDGTITGIGGKCIDAAGISSANGTALILWDCWGGENQKWQVCR